MRYPISEPHEPWTLEVGDGHPLYREISCGPGGKPAVVLHRGPGGKALRESGVWSTLLDTARSSSTSATPAAVPPSATGSVVDLSAKPPGTWSPTSR
ncbi:hypothetical protein [Lentzea cavernae]|uniref:hypothetical protein n=1 Tax=Lentzea cavernae TaxID=2020703 RepID=UPI00174B7B03|nr:hypothetical protein [Lentzea cavernae]